LATRMKGLKSSFKNLDFEQRRKDRYRDIRELMSPSAAQAGNKDGQRRAREANVRFMEEGEAYRTEQYFNRINKDHTLDRHMDEERFGTRMKFAQMTLEDRVRWRHNYAAVEEERANERAGVIEDARRKQAQLDFAAKRGEAVGAMRREVMNLRATHRSLDEYRCCRKEEYEKAVNAKKIAELGERRIEVTGGHMTASQLSPKPASFFKVPSSPAADSFSTASPPASPAHAPQISGVSSPAHGQRVPSASATPKASAGPLLDYSDIDAIEQLGADELRWMRRVASPKASRGGLGSTGGGLGLSRSSTAPSGLLPRGASGSRGGGRPRPQPLGL